VGLITCVSELNLGIPTEALIYGEKLKTMKNGCRNIVRIPTHRLDVPASGRLLSLAHRPLRPHDNNALWYSNLFRLIPHKMFFAKYFWFFFFFFNVLFKNHKTKNLRNIVRTYIYCDEVSFYKP